MQLAGLELAAVGTVMDPLALGFDIFAGGNLRDRTNERHEVPLAAHVHAHDTKAALRAVEGDTLNDTSESFQGRRSDGRRRVMPGCGHTASLTSQAMLRRCPTAPPCPVSVVRFRFFFTLLRFLSRARLSSKPNRRGHVMRSSLCVAMHRSASAIVSYLLRLAHPRIAVLYV